MIKFKSEKDKTLFCSLHPVLIMIFSDMYWYAYKKHKVELVVTQTVTNREIDERYSRVSNSHRTCRAIDIRTRNLEKEVVQDLKKYINSKEEYKEHHYVSRSGKKRLAYWHMGTEEHFHLAIHSKYSL